MKYLFLGISILFTAFIFSMSSATGEESASWSLLIASWTEGSIERLIPSWNVDGEFLHLAIRKTAHFGEFFLLGISYALTFRAFKLPLWSLVAAGLAVAILDELSQVFAENRGPSVVDALVFDFPGYAVGSLLTHWITSRPSPKINAS